MYIYIKMKMKALNMFQKPVVLGGGAVSAWDAYNKRIFHGVSGNHGTLRGTRGGGSGGCHCQYYSSYSGRGGNGTSYSGGAGGLLIMCANSIKNNGIISSNGTSGGTGRLSSGGSSGGGSINIFYKETINKENIYSYGGIGPNPWDYGAKWR